MSALGVIISAIASLSSIWWSGLRDVLKDVQKQVTDDEIKKAFIDFGKGRRKKKAFDGAFEKAANEFVRSYEQQPQLAEILKNLLELPDPQANDFRRQALRMFFFSREVDYQALNQAFRQHIGYEALFKGALKPEFSEEQLLHAFGEFMVLFRNAALDEAELRPILIDIENQKAINKLQVAVEKAQTGEEPFFVIPTEKKIDEAEYQKYLASYLEYIKNETQRIRLIGFSHGRTEVEEPQIDKLFVPLNAVTGSEKDRFEERLTPDEERLAREDFHLFRQPKADRERAAAKQIRLVEAVNDDTRLVILGDPGSGKTTMLRYVAFICATGKGSATFNFSHERIPIFIEFRTFNKNRQKRGPGYDVFDYLYETIKQTGREIPKAFYRHLFEKGKAILLFDGLDEVMEEEQRYEIHIIVEQLIAHYQDLPCIITCRITGYGIARFSPDQFQHTTLLPFTDDDIQQFVTHWYCCVEQAAENVAKEYATTLVERIQQTPGTRRLAVNPLMLTIICTIHRTEVLPNQRHKLYDKAVESLL